MIVQFGPGSLSNLIAMALKHFSSVKETLMLHRILVSYNTIFSKESEERKQLRPKI